MLVIFLSFFITITIRGILDIIDGRIFYIDEHHCQEWPHAAWGRILLFKGNNTIKNVIQVSLENDLAKLTTIAKVLDPNHISEWAVAFFSLTTRVMHTTISVEDVDYVELTLKDGEKMHVKANKFVNNQIRFKRGQSRKKVLADCDTMFIELQKNSGNRFKIDKDIRQLVAYACLNLSAARMTSRKWLKIRFLYKILRHGSR